MYREAVALTASLKLIQYGVRYWNYSRIQYYCDKQSMLDFTANELRILLVLLQMFEIGNPLSHSRL
jgi:hypothetical protein